MYSDHPQEEDLFNLLPDAIVRLIFNKVHDAKSLCRCKSVCRRFGSIVPEIDTVVLTIPPRINPTPISNGAKESTDRNPKPRKDLLKGLINKIILKPFQFLLQIVIKRSASIWEEDDDGFSSHSPNEALKSFNEIRSLRIELPSRERETGSNNSKTLLKWKAEFGEKLESCVILGAKSLEKYGKSDSNENGEEEHEYGHDALFSDDELKLRIVWTISCLIAASARHYFLQQVVSEQRILENVEVTDVGRQGRVCMGKKQIEALRKSMDTLRKSEELVVCNERTRVPALRMKMWYVPVLVLPAAGWVLKGATLVVIRPVEAPKRAEGNGELVVGAFDGEEEVFGEAVRSLMEKKNSYTLEMNSF